jgi:hypothetical protein
MTALSGTLDPSLAFLGLDPFAPEPPAEAAPPEMPDWLAQDSGWVWAPADCACTDHCSCEVRVPTFATRWNAVEAVVQGGPSATDANVRWAVPGLWGEPPAPAAAAFVVGGLVERLQDTLGLLETTLPAELPGPQALAETEALLAVSQRLRVQLLPRLRDVDARKLHQLRDAKSAGSWLKRTAPDAHSSDLTLARRLGEARYLAAALDAGVVSLQGADLVQKSLGTLRRYLDRPDGLIDGQPGEPLVEATLSNVLELVCRQYLGLADDDPRLQTLDTRLGAINAGGGSQQARLEQAFVVLAEHLPPTPLKAALAEIVDALVPNLLELAEERSRARRALKVVPIETGWKISGELTFECGERLVTALAAEVRRDDANPTDTAAWAEARAQAERQSRDIFEVLTEQDDLNDPAPWDPAGEPAVSKRPRARPERLHDALNNLLARFLGAGLGGVHDKVPVQVTVTLSDGQVEGRPGALPGKGGSGRPLARSLLRRWWCDSHVTALSMSRGGRPLGVAHRGRTLTGSERTALQVQSDNRCAAVECCSGTPDPLQRLVPHHVRRYADDGITSMEESLLLCDTAHHDIHTGKRKLHLRDGRTVDESGWIVEDTD